jgi:hypothetical protein
MGYCLSESKPYFFCMKSSSSTDLNLYGSMPSPSSGSRVCTSCESINLDASAGVFIMSKILNPSVSYGSRGVLFLRE